MARLKQPGAKATHRQQPIRAGMGQSGGAGRRTRQTPFPTQRGACMHNHARTRNGLAMRHRTGFGFNPQALFAGRFPGRNPFPRARAFLYIYIAREGGGFLLRRSRLHGHRARRQSPDAASHFAGGCLASIRRNGQGRQRRTPRSQCQHAARTLRSSDQKPKKARPSIIQTCGHTAKKKPRLGPGRNYRSTGFLLS
jgi:hypothetical protein